MKHFKIFLWLFSIISVVHSTLNCNYVLTETSGTIKTPFFPQKYPHDLNCSWKIIVGNGRKIVLKTKRFDLEPSYNCESDALYIYDGGDETAKLYSKPYCGIKGPVNVTSSDNSLLLRFITDKLDNARGFLIEYHSVKGRDYYCYSTERLLKWPDKENYDVCDFEFNGDNGTFTSPRFPKNYYEDANCSYRIKTDKHKAIVLKFQHFQLENAVSGSCLDYVSVYDILATVPVLVKKMCGIGLPLPIQSSSNEMLVKFHSDNLINNPGFKATFQSIFRRCKSGEFKCDNGRCIHVRLLCNEINDCSDNTDEVFCKCDRHRCDNHRCVDHDRVCNGENDCGDWSDENECSGYGKLKTTISTTQSSTLRQTSKRATTPRISTTPVWRCPYGQFNCKSNVCIEASQRCDGYDDCGDNSDESDCVGQCRNLNGGCQHICDYNRKTGVRCSCYDGFKLDSDNLSCIDKDECTSRPCAGSCDNTFGSYQCGCPKGYRLHHDKYNCTDYNECSLSGICEQRCINKIGSYECACFDGYKYDKNQQRCVDIDECSKQNGGCSESCVNTIGSYSCTCFKKGYVMVPGKTTCEEVDECELGTSLCQQECINTDGSYICRCRKGFRLGYDKHKCIDVDECLEGVPGCWGNCINTAGSYRCECDVGFRGIMNNTKCEDINECTNNNGGCSNLCTNTKGSFRCSCHKGFIKRDSRAFTCIDKNECDDNPCDEDCINTPGSFQCRCKDGFELVNVTKCQDIDECAQGTAGCDHLCTNTRGSYLCACPDGLILDSDKKHCITAVNGTGCRRLRVDTNQILVSDWTNVTDGWAWQAWISLSFQQLNINIPRFRCMGTLIHEEFVLTTGHCVKYGNIPIDAQRLRVWLGSYIYGVADSYVNASVKKVIYHDTYDLALLHLTERVKVSMRIQPLCLFQGDHDVDVALKKTVVAATWKPNRLESSRLQQIYATVGEPHLCTWNSKRLFRGQDSICVRFGPQKININSKQNCAGPQEKGMFQDVDVKVQRIATNVTFSRKKDTSQDVDVKNQTNLHPPFLPMSGTPLVGMLRGTPKERKRQKWYLTGILVYGDGYPGTRKTFSRLYKYVGFRHANSFVKWLRQEIKNIENQ